MALPAESTASPERGVRAVGARPAEVGRINDRGIDDESESRVVRGDLETDLMIPSEREASVDRLPLAVLLLVDDRLGQAHLAAVERHDEVSLCVERRRASPEAEVDACGVGAGLHDEVVLELAPATVVHEVDAWIYVRVRDFRISRHVRVPLRWVAAAVVIDLAGQRLSSHPRRRPGGGAEKIHLDDRGVRPALLQCQHRALAPEEERITASPGKKLHARVRLADVRLERQRELTVVGRCEGAGC